jgi:hypothetical protein
MNNKPELHPDIPPEVRMFGEHRIYDIDGLAEDTVWVATKLGARPTGYNYDPANYMATPDVTISAPPPSTEVHTPTETIRIGEAEQSYTPVVSESQETQTYAADQKDAAKNSNNTALLEDAYRQLRDANGPTAANRELESV